MTNGFTSDTELGTLLDEELGYEATTARGLTSHLPMALVAKAALGAPTGELRRFAERYRRRLVPRGTPDACLSASTWKTAVGQPGSYDDLVEYFLGAVDVDGVDGTLRRHLDALISGIYGAAFHGAIRLAYAIEIGSPSRVAAGLAYLAERAVSIGEPLAARPTTDQALDVFTALSTSGAFDHPASRGLIADEMADAGANPRFWELLSTCELGDSTPEQLRAAALSLYATTGDFTSLHAVTGVEALSALRPYAQDQGRFDAACLTGVAAAYASVGAPPMASSDRLDELVANHDVAVEATRHVGAMSDDEHVAKLIYTSLRLHAVTGDELYLVVAARKAGLSTVTP